MKNPQTVLNNAMKGFAGLQQTVTMLPYIHKSYPNNPGTAQ